MSVALTFHGIACRLVDRLPGGKVRVEYLRHGAPSGLTDHAWPHEIRGARSFAQLRQLIDVLPERDAPAPAASPSDDQATRRPRAFLHAQHAATERED